MEQPFPSHIAVRYFLSSGEGVTIPQELLLTPPSSTKDASNNHGVIDAQILASTTVIGTSLDVVVSLFHFQSAVVQAWQLQGLHKMKTKCIQTEILYRLAVTGNINDAIRQFLLMSDTKCFAVLCLGEDMPARSQFEDLCQQLVTNNTADVLRELTEEEVQNTLANMNEMKRERLKKLFKLTPQESDPKHIEHSILTKVALKDF